MFVLLILLMGSAVMEPNRVWITGLITLFLLAVILVITSKILRGREVFRILAIALLVLELWAGNTSLLPMVDRSFYEKRPDLLAKIDKEGSLYRVYGGRLLDEKELPTANQFPERKNLMASHLATKNLLRPNLGIIYGLNYMDGLTGLELRSGWLWTELFIKSPPEKRILMLKRSNVRYWINDNYKTDFSEGTVETFPSALPRAFLVGRALKGKAPHLLNTYYNPAFDPLKQVLINENINWRPKENFSGQVERIEYSPNRVSIETNQDGEGALVLLDSYFPGWKVWVDGQPSHIFRANYFYRGVKLSSGKHKIEFLYTPEGFQLGRRVSLLTLVFILSGLVFFRFRNLRWL